MKIERIVRLFLPLLLLFTLTAWADSIPRSQQELKEGALKFLRHNIKITADEEVKIEIGQLDPRLNIPACSGSTEYFLPTGIVNTNITTVGLRCNFPKPWTIYIPVVVEIMSDVLVAARDINRGEAITEADVELAKQNRAELHTAFFKTKDSLANQVAATNIAKGAVVTQQMLTLPTIIVKGETVMMTCRVRNVLVQSKGIAQSNGSLNKFSVEPYHFFLQIDAHTLPLMKKSHHI